MAVTKTTKLEFVQRLLSTKQKASTLEMTLRFKGKKDEADQVKNSNAKLQSQIDILLGKIIDDWLAQGTQITDEIKGLNTKLQRSIASIQNNVNTAQNIVKAVGLIDDAVALAAKVAKSIA